MIKQVQKTSKWIIDQFDILLYSVFGAKIDSVNKTSYNVQCITVLVNTVRKCEVQGVGVLGIECTMEAGRVSFKGIL